MSTKSIGTHQTVLKHIPTLLWVPPDPSAKQTLLIAWTLFSMFENSVLLPYCFAVAQSCLTLCDPMDCSTPGLPVPHHLLIKFTNLSFPRKSNKSVNHTTLNYMCRFGNICLFLVFVLLLFFDSLLGSCLSSYFRRNFNTLDNQTSFL